MSALGVGKVDANSSTVESHAVAGIPSLHSILHIGVVNETEAAGSSCSLVNNKFHFVDVSESRKLILEISFRSLRAEAEDTKHFARLWLRLIASFGAASTAASSRATAF